MSFLEKIKNDIVESQVWKAIFRHGYDDTPRNRALSATARLKQMPFVIELGKQNLTKPVQLYAQLAIDSARSIDSLFNDSMMTLAKDMSPAAPGRSANIGRPRPPLT